MSRTRYQHPARLAELSERISQALKDDNELKEAVKRLLNRQNDKLRTDQTESSGPA